MEVWKKTIILVGLILMSFSTPPAKFKVYLIGDSTIAKKMISAYPETGWGMPFQYFFDSTVVVSNHAMNGRSTRTFISEGRWHPIADSLKEGDFVFIQFGHNDESKEKVDRYTSPADYKKNLTFFISETRKKNGIPVLLTPVARRSFDDNGKVLGSHDHYSALVREVALEQKVVLIDLDLKSQELLEEFGVEDSKLLFLQLKPGEHPNYPEGKDDNTHFNELGARKIAQIVLHEIKNQNIGLAERIVKPKLKP